MKTNTKTKVTATPKDIQWRKLKAIVKKEEPGLIEYIIKMGWEKRMKDEILGLTK